MKKLRNFGLVVHLLVILLNPWFWLIVQRNFLAGLLVFSLSLVVFVYFWQLKSARILLLLVILTISVFFVATREAFDESIFRKSALDIQEQNKRHEFYANGLGKLYKNRFVLTYFKDYHFPIFKLQRNFFSNLDPNLYFFASHPRERVGIEEFEKYLPIFLPFFLLGFFYSLYKPLPNLLLYFIIISVISSVINPLYNLGPVLFFSVINFMITIGFILSWRKISRYFEKL